MVIALKIITAVALFLSAWNVGFTQTGRSGAPVKLTLQKCVELALERNIQLKQLQNNVEIAGVNVLQSRLSYIPNLNMSVDFRQNYGTTFNQLLFQRINQTVDGSNPSIVASTDVFRSFAKYYTYKDNQNALEAAVYNVERNTNTIITNVLAAYLLILFDHSNIRITQERIKALDTQAERVDKLLTAGAATQIDLSNIKSQLATENVTLVTQENQLERDKLSLLILMQAHTDDQAYDFEIIDAESLNLDENPLPPLYQVETYAVENMPEIKQVKAQVKSSEYKIKSARTALYPSVTLSLGAVSNYNYVHNLTYQGVTIKQDGYFKQVLDNNLSRFVSFQLNVPIFNGYNVRRNVAVAQLNAANTRLTLQNEINNLIKNVQQAYLDAKLARSRFDAVNKQLAVSRESYDLAEKRFNAGALNFYSFFETLNNKTRVETERLSAKYDFYFKRKILDVYQGAGVNF